MSLGQSRPSLGGLRTSGKTTRGHEEEIPLSHALLVTIPTLADDPAEIAARSEIARQEKIAELEAEQRRDGATDERLRKRPRS